MKILFAGTMGVAALIAFSGARAWEEPDAVFAKFHQAVKAGDAGEMARLSSAARRADMAPRKDAEVREAQAGAPSAYALERKLVSRDGQSAKLFLSAPGEGFSPARAGAQYGIARMQLEGGEWKVAGATWAREKPAELEPRRAPAAASGARVRDATRLRPLPQAPMLKLAQPACTYKGVMSDDEIERCR